MANSDTVFGFREVKKSDPRFYQSFAIAAGYATALAIGDAVEQELTMSTPAGYEHGLPNIKVLAAGQLDAAGVIVGFEGPPNRDNRFQNYSAASTASVAIVNVDPNARYVVQEDSVGGAISSITVGQLCDLIDAGVDTATGSSGQELDSSTITTSGQFRVRELYRAADNAIGTNALWIVSWSEHMDVGAPVAVE